MELDSDIMENHLNGIAFFTEKGDYLSSNEIFKRFLQKEESHLKGRNIVDIFKEVILEKVKASFEKKRCNDSYR